MEHRSSQRGLLLDRGSEIAAIEQAVDAARAGSGSVLLIEGAAGIGKSRLLGHGCDLATAAGMTMLSARAAEYEDGYAWGVVRQLFEAELRAGLAAPGEQAAARATPRRSPSGCSPSPPGPATRTRTRCCTACTGWPQTSRSACRCCSRSMTCSGPTVRRSASPPT
ncbi:ATP-binding protein [Trebonia kvetii]|uniref:ATP-binding protein n=1 Tax=Trebonia kvetii TaxID=2480626 RepID=A0A6P2C785_9ACTN|nr:ATP-binding protein [Trebonia kvetii]TVZ07080.1 ATP-binding protein [Trebonia kvetii]